MAAEDFGSTTPKFAGVSGAWTVIGGCYTGTPGTDAALSTMGLVVDGVPGGAPGHGQHPGNGGAPAPSAPAPVIEAVLAETAAKKQTWVFDELSGGVLRRWDEALLGRDQ
jgi:hypothetical protein